MIVLGILMLSAATCAGAVAIQSESATQPVDHENRFSVVEPASYPGTTLTHEVVLAIITVIVICVIFVIMLWAFVKWDAIIRFIRVPSATPVAYRQNTPLSASADTLPVIQMWYLGPPSSPPLSLPPKAVVAESRRGGDSVGHCQSVVDDPQRQA